MKAFDKKIKELSRNVQIPKEYDKRIEELLDTLPEKEVSNKANNKRRLVKRLAIAVCIICFIGLLKLSTLEASANFFETFKLTIMDILNIDKEDSSGDIGVSSAPERVESKPDLMLELQEKVMDSHNIYLRVKITAPANVVLDADTAFDYFAFCEGQNYNTDHLLSGSKDCYLMEAMKEKPNVATYLVSINTDRQLQEDSTVTVTFKDLTRNPFSDNPLLLVEGMWSISFAVNATVKESIVIEGRSDMTYPYINTTAALENIELTPLGMCILSDISNTPSEELGVSDTTIAVRLIMIDGNELIVMSHNPEEALIIDSGSVEFSEDNGRSYQKDIYAFSEALDINKVVGIYIEDLYVPAQ